MTRSFPSLFCAALVWVLCFADPLNSRADSVTLFPSADATMIERNPENSMGAGYWIASGTTQNGNSNRALIKFDVASAVPAGSTVIGADLFLWVTGQPRDGYAESLFSLRRVFRPWGEGSNPTPLFSPGIGLPAEIGDVTWLYCFFDGDAWTVPGGLEDVDYSASISGSTTIAGARSMEYWFEAVSTADVQLWLDHPQTNFGWMLKSEEELSRFTARRFGSRELEDPSASPQLRINYLLPLRLTSLTTNNQIQLTFHADTGYSYQVESRDTLGGTNAWTVLTNYGLSFTTGPRTATDSLTNGQRFYRVRRD